LEKEELIESLNGKIDSLNRGKEKLSMQLNAKINKKELEVENFKLKIEKLKKINLVNF
jgi:TolA-binding protein